MTENPYIRDILSQPEAVQAALDRFDPSPVAPLAVALQRGDFDRIVLTGMGGSLYASYPVWLTLASAGLPAFWMDTAELIHHAPGLVTSKTLFWLFSQSGQSAEIVSALDFERIRRPAVLLATVNDLDSPLAQAVQNAGGLSAYIPIHAGVEAAVSTRSYINTLAVGQLAALALLSRDVDAAKDSLQETVAAMRNYLASWQEQVQMLGQQLGFPKRLAVLGRGPSMAAVYTGTLLLAEAAKFLAMPYQAAEFRHGPLELANPDLTVLLFEGPVETRDLNQRLFQELRSYHVKAFWIGSSPEKWQVQIPEVQAIGLPLLEILPLQLLSIHLAKQIGVEPGQFFRSGKITLEE
jgi:glucosamine--fructose-6-phosphate aminotransferase (isomerizing)